MYNLTDIKTIHLEVTSKCQASCPMCPRNIQGGIANPWLHETEITIEKFKAWVPANFVQQLDRLYMCGNLGDAIVAKDTLEIFQYLRQHNSSMHLSLHTNGSARNKTWWQSLAQIGVEVTFALDGLEDTNHLYRIGTDFNKIIENAKTFIQAGGRAKWHMLVFEHNTHQIDTCEQLSKALGFVAFSQKNSSRFRGPFMNVLTKEGTTSHKIYPSSRSSEISQKVMEQKIKLMFGAEEDNVKITCKAQEENSMYIGANGILAPCCWLDYTGTTPNSVSLVDYKDQGFVNPNLNTHSLEEIFESKHFDKIESTWDSKPLHQCRRQCGKFDKLNEQFK